MGVAADDVVDARTHMHAAAAPSVWLPMRPRMHAHTHTHSACALTRIHANTHTLIHIAHAAAAPRVWLLMRSRMRTKPLWPWKKSSLRAAMRRYSPMKSSGMDSSAGTWGKCGRGGRAREGRGDGGAPGGWAQGVAAGVGGT
eukprot:18927-Chlamydomonas_euryale.AAC.1